MNVKKILKIRILFVNLICVYNYVYKTCRNLEWFNLTWTLLLKHFTYNLCIIYYKAIHNVYYNALYVFINKL